MLTSDADFSTFILESLHLFSENENPRDVTKARKTNKIRRACLHEPRRSCQSTSHIQLGTIHADLDPFTLGVEDLVWIWCLGSNMLSSPSRSHRGACANHWWGRTLREESRILPCFYGAPSVHVIAPL